MMMGSFGGCAGRSRLFTLALVLGALAGHAHAAVDYSENFEGGTASPPSGFSLVVSAGAEASTDWASAAAGRAGGNGVVVTVTAAASPLDAVLQAGPARARP